MKKLLIIGLLLASSTVHATVKCQSIRDPGFRAYFPGYTCPAGYFMVG